MAKGEKPNERRRAERVPVNAEFGTIPTPSYVSDLSKHGVFVHTDQDLPAGTSITLRFTVLLDDPVGIVARGRVARRQTSPPGLGIEFVELSPEMLLRIDDIVAHQRPRELGPPLKSTAKPVDRRNLGGDTKVVPAPPSPSDPEFDDSKTMVKLQALDVEIIDEDEDDAATTTAKGRLP